MNCTSSKSGEKSNKATADKDFLKRDGVEEKEEIEIMMEDMPFTEHVEYVSVQNDVGRWPVGQDEVLVVSEDLVMQHLKSNERKQLKAVIRGASDWSPNHKIRRFLWKQICTYLHKSDGGNLYEEMETEIISHDQSEIRLPSFVDTNHTELYKLTTDGAVAVRKILAVIELTNPDITFCPILHSVVSLFLHYMSPSDCFNCVYGLLRDKNAGYIPQTKVSYEASRSVMRDLTKRYAKSAYSHLVRMSTKLEAVFDGWMWWILRDLPFHYLVRVMDCYLVEGIKIFYRVALAILILYVKHSGKKGSQKQMEAGQMDDSLLVENIQQFCRDMPVRIDKLFKTGFNLALGIRGLNRKEIRKLQTKYEMYINSHNHLYDSNIPISRSFSGPVVLQNVPSNQLAIDMFPAMFVSITKSILSLINRSTMFYTTETTCFFYASMHVYR